MILWIARTFEPNPSSPPDWWAKMRREEDAREEAIWKQMRFARKHPFLHWLLSKVRRHA